MLSFCENIERNLDLRTRYHKIVEQLAQWYINTEAKYSSMLRTELGLSKMANELKCSDVSEELLSDLTGDLSYCISTKLAYFCVADTLVKLILSKYSFGPTQRFIEAHELAFRPEFKDRTQQSWLSCKADEPVMAEVAAKVLRDEEKEFSIDFQALAADRSVRSKLAHTTETDQCLSAIRCYNVIRNMLIFLDPKYADELPEFPLEDMFSYDRFLAEPCGFNFNDYTTILIADSVHDIRADYRGAVANLGWDTVIDLDGYSDAGGLLSSVSHNSLLKEVLYRTKANELSHLPYEKTLWCRCGEYLSYGFEPSDAFSIVPYIHFHKDRGTSSKPNNLKDILRQVLKCAKSQDRAINIVAVTNDEFIVKQLISVIRAPSIDLDNYFLSWVGLTGNSSRIADWFDDDQEELEHHFYHHQCPICQFYKAFAEYSGDWTPRASLSSDFTLPGVNGPIPVREIERNNLESYFDVLYDHCEEEAADRLEELRTAFYRGNTAAWSVIATGGAAILRKSADFENMKQRIRSTLGLTQSDPQKRLFFIQHAAGIGGSTLARQLVWDLHQDYAVLSVRTYNSSIKNRIEHLYDVVLDKSPVIILAEDTLPNFDRLCADVCRLNRRCVLVAACRQSNTTIKETYPQAYYEPFTSIPNKLIAPLQNCYRFASPLPETELKRKDQDFSNVVTGQMLTPFIIGLYYMDRDFNIDTYVGKALEECTERRYADMLACIALCDRYGRKNVPISFVNKGLSMSQQLGFLRIVPAAGSLISSERQSSNIDCYHFKHELLSNRFLELYCEKYYSGADNLQNALYDNTLLLIDKMAAMGRSLQVAHLDILIFILIQNKRVDSVNQYLSALMQDIAMPENQMILMRRLAERFKPLADSILEEQADVGIVYDRRDRQILRLVSHAYAHLGRMYSKIDNNYPKAFEEFKNAIEYMPDDDPNIYHMAGSALLDKLKGIWRDCQTGPIPTELDSEIRTDVAQACEYFNCASDFGSPEYGYPSKLDLLCSYLQFIFRISGIRNINDIPKDTFLNQLQIDFINTLEEAKSYPDFDETAKECIDGYERKFRSQIMFGNFSKAIEFYQNQVDCLKGTGDIGGLNNSLRGLAFAHIHAARANFPNLPFYRGVKNPAKLLDIIETLLNQPSHPERYSDYTTRTQFFRYWMQLAKVLNYPIESGLAMVRRWLELEGRNKQNKNPEPYYYKGLLLYLSARNGSSHALSELHQLSSEISGLDANSAFDNRRGSLRKIHDVFIEGKEMGQLFDVHYCRTEEDIFSALAEVNRKPVGISGNFVSTQYNNYALLQIFNPSCWSGETAWMNIGKSAQSAFTSAQIGHKLMFIMGFSTERPIALSRYVADLSTGERLDIDDYIRKAKAEKNESAVSHPRTNQKSAQARPPVSAGTAIEIILDHVDKDRAQGHAVNDDSLVVEAKLKTKADKKKAKPKSKLKVRITGEQKNNIYQGTII